jgi:hypothetical protein
LSARAREALERIAALYAIEKTIRSRSAGERRTDRQEKSNGRGRTKQGYFWAIARDDRAWCGRALSKPPSSVTRSQVVKAVRSEGRLRSARLQSSKM